MKRCRSRKIKKVDLAINKILKAKISNEEVFGKFASGILFPKNSYSLVRNSNEYYIFAANKENADNCFSELCELLSKLRYLEDNHMIYVIPKNIDEVIAFSQDVNILRHSMDLTYYDDGGFKLNLEENDSSITTSTNEKLSKFITVSELSPEIDHFLTSCIYPTPLLKNCIDKGFRSNNDYIAHKSLIISRIMIWVSIIVFILSPVITIICSNKFEKATINTDQYDTIIHKLSSITKGIDSIQVSVNNQQLHKEIDQTNEQHKTNNIQ